MKTYNVINKLITKNRPLIIKYFKITLGIILLFGSNKNYVSGQQSALSYFINCVGAIEFKTSQSISIGTGTIILKRIDSAHGWVFIITNKHVLPTSTEASSINFKISKTAMGENSFSNIEIPIYNNAGKLYPYVRISNDEDLAIINFTDFYQQYNLHYLDTFLLPYELLGTAAAIKSNEITQGDEVYFIGYPSFIYDSRNAHPILRIGVISSNPNEDYYFNAYRGGKILHGFLIDANVVGGSSGSLVFLKPQPIQIGLDGTSIITGSKRIPLILGILTEAYLDIDARSPNQKINLGGVISSKKIIDLINEF